MKATFFDHQEERNPLNGSRLDPDEALRILQASRTRDPFFCSLESERGTLLVGVGRDSGCVQFTNADEQPPYLVATIGIDRGDEYITFLSGGTPSPVPRNNCLPWTVIEHIVGHFLRFGAIPRDVEWAEI